MSGRDEAQLPQVFREAEPEPTPEMDITTMSLRALVVCSAPLHTLPGTCRDNQSARS
jgi:hypothetical protein